MKTRTFPYRINNAPSLDAEKNRAIIVSSDKQTNIGTTGVRNEKYLAPINMFLDRSNRQTSRPSHRDRYKEKQILKKTNMAVQFTRRSRQKFQERRKAKKKDSRKMGSNVKRGMNNACSPLSIKGTDDKASNGGRLRMANGNTSVASAYPIFSIARCKMNI